VPPWRWARALEESFAGYRQDPVAILLKSFDETEGCDETIVLRGVRFALKDLQGRVLIARPAVRR
jgi:hypothetical protein